jgi:hypothetical protein
MIKETNSKEVIFGDWGIFIFVNNTNLKLVIWGRHEGLLVNARKKNQIMRF